MDMDFVYKFIPAVIVGAALAVTMGYKMITHAPDDNVVEEIAEEVIKKQTDFDVDLSPMSKEKT